MFIVLTTTNGYESIHNMYNIIRVEPIVDDANRCLVTFVGGGALVYATPYDEVRNDLLPVYLEAISSTVEQFENVESSQDAVDSEIIPSENISQDDGLITSVETQVNEIPVEKAKNKKG